MKKAVAVPTHPIGACMSRPRWETRLDSYDRQVRRVEERQRELVVFLDSTVILLTTSDRILRFDKSKKIKASAEQYY
jgi:hypothetical protein